jgi:SseB protein N-terminal domain
MAWAIEDRADHAVVPSALTSCGLVYAEVKTGAGQDPRDLLLPVVRRRRRRVMGKVVELICPFCWKGVTIFTATATTAHIAPPCEDFERLTPLEFLQAVRAKIDPDSGGTDAAPLQAPAHRAGEADARRVELLLVERAAHDHPRRERAALRAIMRGTVIVLMKGGDYQQALSRAAAGAPDVDDLFKTGNHGQHGPGWIPVFTSRKFARGFPQKAGTHEWELGAANLLSKFRDCNVVFNPGSRTEWRVRGTRLGKLMADCVGADDDIAAHPLVPGAVDATAEEEPSEERTADYRELIARAQDDPPAIASLMQALLQGTLFVPMAESRATIHGLATSGGNSLTSTDIQFQHWHTDDIEQTRWIPVFSSISLLHEGTEGRPGNWIRIASRDLFRLARHENVLLNPGTRYQFGILGNYVRMLAEGQVLPFDGRHVVRADQIDGFQERPGDSDQLTKALSDLFERFTVVRAAFAFRIRVDGAIRCAIVADVDRLAGTAQLVADFTLVAGTTKADEAPPLGITLVTDDSDSPFARLVRSGTAQPFYSRPPSN